MQGKLFTPDTIAALAQIGRDPDEVAAALDEHLRLHPQSDELRVAERPPERRPNDPTPVYLRDIALRRRRVEGGGWVWAVVVSASGIKLTATRNGPEIKVRAAWPFDPVARTQKSDSHHWDALDLAADPNAEAKVRSAVVAMARGATEAEVDRVVADAMRLARA